MAFRMNCRCIRFRSPSIGSPNITMERPRRSKKPSQPFPRVAITAVVGALGRAPKCATAIPPQGVFLIPDPTAGRPGGLGSPPLRTMPFAIGKKKPRPEWWPGP
jgi:hypothetical protein